MNTALRNMQVGYLRSAFLRWKDKAHQCSIHMQNEEEDGPCNLKAW